MTQSISLPIPAAYSLDSYIQTVNRYPMLSLEEEQDFARAWHDKQDVEAARQLVVSHLRVVVSVARHYLGYGLPHADLIQEGNIGLMKAVKRFDPDRGVRLVSFALHWVRAEIHEYVLKNWRLVKVATTKSQRKLFFNLRSLKQSLNALTLQEADAMARELNVSRKDVLEMETRMSGHDVAIDPAVDNGEEGYSPLAYLASPDESPAQLFEREQTERLRHAGLTQALENLDERSRHIIQSRWLTEGEAATLHELAAQYGVSAERIRQIEARALQKMRAAMPA
ncbi:MAG: RNA polymerase factor sigma-32 [Thiobacillus sp. 63-78]|uniref:RNA polymerase sigma factor RpoH n=1 Tax=Thiobacillus sp. 63-78 TaxID=1895859 RepID=UPI00086DDB3A|nr:RNA polymerase sigma factor RpoH [Thiobacillus sp. 63-78]MBN8763209.1 RNA polymerase sigma factor RpoH [Thiobacillus sp.]ODV12765.1 MAG: RNA polymerase factor sigma-32 [Thiobacillus sp. SCN 64-317]MBN8765053.1 RNA polymerase sigma factor RpoH [Thiobacillus sp.]MBN8773912.1 RNA polymerase sigma factor RpoH [Thiobacillus sp.]OJZ14822.1 MAG: RNA polymerase factor sigma-32 [Thiobacillus sp. 63-78]